MSERLIPWERICSIPVGSKVIVRKTRDYRCDCYLESYADKIGTVKNINGDSILLSYTGDPRCITEKHWEHEFYNSAAIYVISLENLCNKGQTKCLQCGCKTSMRRDFLTFEVREFCPRCKI